MLRKIGLLTVLAAGFVVMVLTTALCATPLVVELTRLYQPKEAPASTVQPAGDGTTAVKAVGTIDRPQYTADDIIAVKASDTDEFAKYEINKTKSTVEFQALSVEFPAGMTDDGIEQAIKNHPSEFVAKHDIWHTVPKKGNQ
jgi:hypothetical protein